MGFNSGFKGLKQSTSSWRFYSSYHNDVRNREPETFHLGYKNQSVYAVSGTSRCFSSDKYKIHKYGVGRA